MFCASVSAGLRSSSGPKSALRTFRREIGLGLLGPWFGRAFRFGVESRSRDLCLEPQRRAPRARRAALELRRAVARRDRAIEAEQREQGAALLGRQFRLDPDLAAPERGEIDALDRRNGRLCGDRGDALELRRVEIERRRAPGRGRTVRHSLLRSSASFSARRARARPHRIEPRSQRRRKRDDQAVNWPSEAALELSANHPVALTRSKLPAPSSVTLSGWPIFNCSSDSFAGE